MTSKPRRVGDELRARREELGISLHKVEVATKIRGRYLRAIEAHDYANLPNDVYSKGFVRQYAQYLELNGAEFATRYQQERGSQQPNSRQTKPRALVLRGGASSRLTASLVLLGVIGVIAAYMIWQFSSLTASPKLTLESPSKDGVVTQSALEVRGATSAGSDVFLNDTLLPSDVNGKFATTLILQSGVNEVRVRSRNKLGKETTVTRNILNQQVDKEALPTAVFDGLAVEVAAKEASSVILMADGKEVYKGVLAPGSKRLVRGTTISVETTNAGGVSLKVTNSKLANYDFGVLGTSGASRTVEFSKDTQLNQP